MRIAYRRKAANKKSSWKSLIWLALIIYLIGVLSYQQIKLNSLAEQKALLITQDDNIGGKVEEMTEMSKIVSSLDYIEYCVRTKLGWMKKDEKRYEAK